MLGFLVLGMLSAFYHTQAQTVTSTQGLDDIDDENSGVPSIVTSSTSSITVSSATNVSTFTPTANRTASASRLDVVHDMCWRFFHQSIIKDETLYIDGGLQSFVDNGTDRWLPGGSTTLGYNRYLIEINLSHPFDWQRNVSVSILNKTADPDTSNMPPQVSHGVLFGGVRGDGRIWLYGGTTVWWNTEFPGFRLPTTEIYSLWSYDTSSGQWDQYDITSASPMRPSHGLAAEATELGLGFYFNGEVDSGSSQQTQYLGDYFKIFLEGMVIINTTSQTATNISTGAAVGNLARTRGGAAYIPNIGDSGILALLGGTYKPSTSRDDVEMDNFVSMDNITIFDVGAYLRNNSERLWYAQNATGDIPGPRAHFCVIMASAPDNSSHNIYVYAGQGPNGTVYDDIYVLSIPSFTWTKVFQGSSPRFGHTCHQIEDQMITVGGKDSSNLDKQLPCDWEVAGIGIFNMSSLQWGSTFKSEEHAGPYSVPNKVLEQIIE